VEEELVTRSTINAQQEQLIQEAEVEEVEVHQQVQWRSRRFRYSYCKSTRLQQFR
jgi:hypothetical protein